MAVKENSPFRRQSPLQAPDGKKPWVKTPLVESYALSQAAGCRIFLKLENLQPSGSFKSRGMGQYIIRRLEDHDYTTPKSPHIFCSSGGNAGLAAVHASRVLGVQCTVVVPTSTSALMIAKLHAAGASDVVHHGASWQEADDYMRDYIMPRSEDAAIHCPPFDAPDIWAGNSTVCDEILDQLPGIAPPDAIICSVGGGGLFNGIMQSLDAHNVSKTTVLAVETEGAHSLNASVEAGELVALAEISSLATSLGAKKVTRETYEYTCRENVRSIVLPDAEAAMGCWRLADDERIMVELACGVNVALCYDGRLEKALGREVKPEDKIVVLLCGGSNVTVEMLGKWRHQFGEVEETIKGNGSKGVAPSQVTAPRAHTDH